MSTVYQACKRVGRQPSSLSGFWIMRGGSTRCPQNPAYPVAIPQSAWSPAGKTLLLGSVSGSAESLQSLEKTERFWISAPAPWLGASGGERACPCPGHLEGFRQSPSLLAGSWSSELSHTALRLSPSLPPLLGQYFPLRLQVESSLR